MEHPPQSKREHLRRLVAEKQAWSVPLPPGAKNQDFKGWHERGYLPHCDKPGLVQFVTFRLWDSLPASQRGEWKSLLAAERSNAPRSAAPGEEAQAGARSIASPERINSLAHRHDAAREQHRKLEEYIDRGHGECFLRNPHIAALVEKAMCFHHGQRFDLLAWVVMPNHVHALIKVNTTPLLKIIQNWKSFTAVTANKLLVRTGDFWQMDYWDTYMRDSEQTQKAMRYIENNPIKAKLCHTPEDWPFSSARFRNPQTWELKFPS
ncbi:MAG TPA: transposase [Verrucomicrobiae bacterium]|jgi:REP element-mobilizing transposase RayT